MLPHLSGVPHLAPCKQALGGHKVKCVYSLQAPVVERVDSAIQWITQLVSQKLISWIVIYPVYSTIQLMNNPGLYSKGIGKST